MNFFCGPSGQTLAEDLLAFLSTLKVAYYDLLRKINFKIKKFLGFKCFYVFFSF